MKIYRLDKGIILVGKAWEIRTKLKEYSRMYETVNEWINDESKQAFRKSPHSPLSIRK
ncbi:Z-ring formation inhibitor MciZ [Bacillus sp. UMB0899]|uniref:Z-ring formation inhibitor MciZ n=1 Tax=Metabacillus schmidteae TaxID=2730405 RepID=UPI000C7FC980|nr:Z-ring formation inhibitor MciZ [Metabacillus schmidteae]PMC39499.1 Z-ring formation inhibitor MciZ [Bacillus sp. UMB0899]